MMQTKPETEKIENVVSIFGSHNKSFEKSIASDAIETESSFEVEVKRNKDLAEKLRKERQKANQAVLRSYRLKT